MSAPPSHPGPPSTDPAPAVIAIIKGGLGNQLYIYAAARALALRTGRRLYLDTRRGYTADHYGRSYRLDRFPITATAMPEAWRIADDLSSFKHKLIRAINKYLPPDRRWYIAERRQSSTDQLTRLQPRPARITLLGYWQQEAYFHAYGDTLRQELTPPAPTDVHNQNLAERLRQPQAVALHVRRNRFPELLSAAYYNHAIAQLRQTLPAPEFYIFGDDHAWVRQTINFADAPVTAITHNTADELAYLWLLQQSHHLICSNSTFSWWAAWLRTSPGFLYQPV